ncbi:MAG: hypothetical protein ABL936_00405 [Aestuariivirga sp.]
MIRALIILALAIFAAILLTVSHARAQGMCATRAEMVAGLQGSKYGEAATGKGLAMNGQLVIELFVGKETFTILATVPGGERSCIIAAGKTWVEVSNETSGEDL